MAGHLGIVDTAADRESARSAYRSGFQDVPAAPAPTAARASTTRLTSATATSTPPAATRTSARSGRGSRTRASPARNLADDQGAAGHGGRRRRAGVGGGVAAPPRHGLRGPPPAARPAPSVPLAETMGALAALRDEGKAREIGVSNFPPNHLLRALEHAPVFADQVSSIRSSGRTPCSRWPARARCSSRPRAAGPGQGHAQPGDPGDRGGARPHAGPSRAALAARPGRRRPPSRSPRRTSGGWRTSRSSTSR